MLSSLGSCGSPSRGLDRVQEAGVLRVAIDPSFPPFESVDAEGNIVGLDADLADAIAVELGVEAHLVTTGYDALYDALTVGRADVIISALYPDPARSRGFAFSTPYFNAGHVLVVPRESAITGAQDLAGRSLACVFGTVGHMEALSWRESLEPPISVTTAEDAQGVVAHLAAGKVDAAVLDHVSARTALGKHPQLRIVWPPITDEPYVIAARREDEDLVDKIDEILQQLETEGRLEALIEAWMQP